MAKLTRKRPATISHDLKFRGQGEEFELHVEYNNITWEELQSAFDPNDKTTITVDFGGDKREIVLEGRETLIRYFKGDFDSLNAKEITIKYTNIDGTIYKVTGDLLNHYAK